MRVEQFDFSLPEALIALRPAIPRDAARCLVVQKGMFQDRRMRDLPELLAPGDLLVFNDTRVVPAALSGMRRRADGNEARIHLNLHNGSGAGRWRGFARGPCGVCVWMTQSLLRKILPPVVRVNEKGAMSRWILICAAPRWMTP